MAKCIDCVNLCGEEGGSIVNPYPSAWCMENPEYDLIPIREELEKEFECKDYDKL